MTFFDITSRRAAEEALRESEERFRLFVTASVDTLYKMSSDWSEMLILEGMSLLASTTDPSRTWMQRYIPEREQARVSAAIAMAIAGKTMFELEHQCHPQRWQHRLGLFARGSAARCGGGDRGMVRCGHRYLGTGAGRRGPAVGKVMRVAPVRGDGQACQPAACWTIPSCADTRPAFAAWIGSASTLAASAPSPAGFSRRSRLVARGGRLDQLVHAAAVLSHEVLATIARMRAFSAACCSSFMASMRSQAAMNLCRRVGDRDDVAVRHLDVGDRGADGRQFGRHVFQHLGRADELGRLVQRERQQADVPAGQEFRQLS
jgi:hypothetical protein